MFSIIYMMKDRSSIYVEIWLETFDGELIGDGLAKTLDIKTVRKDVKVYYVYEKFVGLEAVACRTCP